MNFRHLRQHFYSVVVENHSMCTMLKSTKRKSQYSLVWAVGQSESVVVKHFIQHFQIETVVLTKGTEGSHVTTLDGTSSYLPTPKVKVADTVGAGDAFTGAFVASLLLGENIREAHQKAVDVSAFVCTQRGAMPEYVR